MLICFAEPGCAGLASDHFQRHVLRVADYLWVAEDGMKMQGYNGSQCWDTSFAVQALVETGLTADPAFTPCIKKVRVTSSSCSDPRPLTTPQKFQSLALSRADANV